MSQQKKDTARRRGKLFYYAGISSNSEERFSECKKYSRKYQEHSSKWKKHSSKCQECSRKCQERFSKWKKRSSKCQERSSGYRLPLRVETHNCASSV